MTAQKWDTSKQRTKTGRSATSDKTKKLVLRFAQENPTWGYDRIADAINNLATLPLGGSAQPGRANNKIISDQTVGNILKEHGIDLAPKRKTQTRWKTFLKAHWDTIAATDFTTVEVWAPKGLVTFYLLFVIELKTRKIEFAGMTPNPNE